jgi:hypothetical protein
MGKYIIVKWAGEKDDFQYENSFIEGEQLYKDDEEEYEDEWGRPISKEEYEKTYGKRRMSRFLESVVNDEDYEELKKHMKIGDIGQALIIAVKGDKLNFVKRLLEDYGHSLSEATITEAFRAAVLENNINMVKYFLKNKKDSIYMDYIMNILALKIGTDPEKWKWDMVKFLINNGANIYAGRNILFRIAIEEGNKEMMNYLMERSRAERFK